VSSMTRTIERTAERLGAGHETGGVLYGERDDALKTVWVDEASEPLPDSQFSSTSFLCGIEGVAECDAHLRRMSGGRRGFIGTWHTHPGGPCQPSHVDIQAMQSLVSGPCRPCRKAILVVGVPRESDMDLYAQLFESAGDCGLSDPGLSGSERN
jgi:integrative and conjugative element protein (TIGR02256 family)